MRSTGVALFSLIAGPTSVGRERFSGLLFRSSDCFATVALWLVSLPVALSLVALLTLRLGSFFLKDRHSPFWLYRQSLLHLSEQDAAQS